MQNLKRPPTPPIHNPTPFIKARGRVRAPPWAQAARHEDPRTGFEQTRETNYYGSPENLTQPV